VSDICSTQAVQPSQQVEPNKTTEPVRSLQPPQPTRSTSSSQSAEVAGHAKRKRRAPDLDDFETRALQYVNGQKATRSRNKKKRSASYSQSRVLQIIRGLRTSGKEPLARGQTLWASEGDLIPSRETFLKSRNGSFPLGLLVSVHERAETSKSRSEIATRFTTLLLHHEYERIQSHCEGQAVAEERFLASTGRDMKDSAQDRTKAQAWLRLMENFGSGALLMPSEALNSV
jgi:hypothetical protein